jgi:hypothetical protein
MINALSPSLRDSRLFELRLHKILRCFCNDLNVIPATEKEGTRKNSLKAKTSSKHYYQFHQTSSLPPELYLALKKTFTELISNEGVPKESLAKQTKKGTKEHKESYIIQSPPSSKTLNKIT